MENTKQNIKQLTQEEIQSFFMQQNEKPFRAKQVYEWLWKKNAPSFDEMTNLSKEIRENLKVHFELINIELINCQKSKDKTQKLGFRLFDNEVVEGVLIPSKQRLTACISTQVGCPLNCDFCATGKLKYKRNLFFNEIVEQVIKINSISEKEFKTGLSNIVIMGMGEPLLNYENTLAAIKIITSDNCLGFSSQRITLSTVGLVNEIKRLADDQIKFNLAISLHSADEMKRSAIMPVNKSNPLNELSEALRYFHQKTKARVTFEYLMLNDFNDSLKDAKKLAEFCKAVPCKINLIEYNPVPSSRFQNSTPEKLNAFVEFLESRNLIVNIRKSKGKDIDAACGQLAGKVSVNN